MPSKRLSPSSDSGRTPDITSMAMEEDPMAAQTGTPSTIIATKISTGP